ncbi:divalent-cation tolerance protein CutA [Planctomicrobium sp. SH527]|uniref:divalent-cation tolerance protein CutA n=1 Tax=Planctomicrobium sp. SH527 TaxID=3448123 RepID=UPI003F5B80FE
MNLSMMYVTVEKREEALSIARQLLSEQLIACANITGEITSVYNWEGSNHESTEVGMLLKTRPELVSKVTERIKCIHSYECPCIVSWDIAEGNFDFFQWVHSETASPQRPGQSPTIEL